MKYFSPNNLISLQYYIFLGLYKYQLCDFGFLLLKVVDKCQIDNKIKVHIIRQGNFVSNRAVDILAKPKKSSNRTTKPLKELGKHPNDNENISLYKGRYGLYIKYKGVNFGVPKSANSEDISIKYALDIIKKKKKANP